jgi:hypothetical protein
LIELFVRSLSVYKDIDLAKEMSQHGYCDASTATRASEIFSSKFKGRLFSTDDWAVLQRLSESEKLKTEKIKVYDTSRPIDRLKALSQGVWKTPTIVTNGEKHVGLDKCMDILDKRQGYPC